MTSSPRPRIAIVDDDPHISELVSTLLEDAGFESITCPHSGEAYSCIREAQPQVILLDVQMAGLNGVAVYHVLQHDILTADIPVIFITADRDRVTTLLPSYAQRGTKILTKPFNLDDLITMIEDTLAPRRTP